MEIKVITRKTSENINKLSIEEMPRLPKSSQIPILKSKEGLEYGSKEDGVIELLIYTNDNGAIEAGYYYGTAKPKNIIKVSTQVGCPSKCQFCDLGNVRFKRNLSVKEIYEQVFLVLAVAKRKGFKQDQINHKINFAGTGEPMLNEHLIIAAKKIAEQNFSMKVSSIVPSTKKVFRNFDFLSELAASIKQPIQLQLSLISTSEEYRKKITGINVASFYEIAEIAKLWRSYNPIRKQINLSLILAEDTPASVSDIIRFFPPKYFRIRFRDYVPTKYGKYHNIESISEERMKYIQKEFQEAGYYVGSEGRPTYTEKTHQLASNVTRGRLLRKEI